MSASEKVKQQLERLGITVRGSPKALAACVGLVALWSGIAHSPGTGNPLPVPTPARPPAELQAWTASALSSTLSGVPWLLNTLPAPDPRQRRPPCQEKFGEQAFNGVCWFRLDVKPPCPNEPGAVSYEHEQKCWIYALRVDRTPTSGDLQTPNGVAAPHE